MLVDSGDYDEVGVPVFVHMFSSKDKSLSPFDERMAMCRLAFEYYKSTSCSVKVLPLEKMVCEATTAVNDGEPMRVGSLYWISSICCFLVLLARLPLYWAVIPSWT